MEISPNLPATNLSASIYSAADSHASTSPASDCGPESALRDRDSGQTIFGWSVSYDPVLCSWKTSQVCLTGELAEFLETWPRAGMMRSGVVTRLPNLDCPTFGSGCSLLPTPGAQPHGVSGSNHCYQLQSMIGRSFYYVPEVEALMGFPARWLD